MSILSLQMCRKIERLAKDYMARPRSGPFMESKKRWISGREGYCTVKDAAYARKHPIIDAKSIPAYSTEELIDFLPAAIKLNDINLFLRIEKHKVLNETFWCVQYINDEYEHPWPSYKGAYLCEALGAAVVFILTTVTATPDGVV